MLGSLPATIDPYVLAEKGMRLSGVLPVRRLPRVAEMCADDRGEVEIDLQFERSEIQGIRMMHGALTAILHVACQRCLEVMELRLAAEPHLVLRRADDPSDDDDKTLIVDKAFPLSELVEDELLLEMPMIPMHNLAECPARSRVSASGAGAGGKRETGASPFSVLDRRNRDKSKSTGKD